jgi:uncharacterized protein|tara:strand:- start:240 stop:782 length:543 start_codon:yes stop_codon:yes gene_type:complete
MELGKGPIDWLQLFKFAKKNLSVISEFNIEDLPRLNEIARNNSDKIKVNYSFYLENNTTPCLDGEISLNIYLTCQRCLEALPLSLEHNFGLAFVKKENQAEELSKHLEIYLFENEELSLIDLISDEILLSIPMVPKHNLDCLSSFKENNNHVQGKENPFAILKNINKPMEARRKNGSTKK